MTPISGGGKARWPVVLAVVIAAACSPSGNGAAAVDGRVLYYQCPMHPAYRSDRPGRAADCGMELVPVYRDGAPAASAGGAEATPRQRSLMGIAVETVSPTTITYQLRTSGRVVTDESRDFRVIAGADGYVQSVSPNLRRGAAVRKGQALAEVNGRDFATAQRSFLYGLRGAEVGTPGRPSADAFGQDPATVLEEARLDLVRLGMGERQVARLRATRQLELAVTLEAPSNGVVVERQIQAGQAFARDAELFRIADLSRVWIIAEASDERLDRLPAGTSARISRPDRRTEALSAVFVDTLPVAEGGSHRPRLRFEVDNRDLRLRPGMLVDVAIDLTAANATLVAANAIVHSAAGPYVFVRSDPGHFVRRNIVLGRTVDDRVEVLEGLTAGELVVTSGGFLLSAATQAAGAPQ